jgi:hypothetical protein
MDKYLIVLVPEFFAVRNSQSRISVPNTWSISMLNQASTHYTQTAVLITADASQDEGAYVSFRPETRLVDLIKYNDFLNITPILAWPLSTETITHSLKKWLTQMGASIEKCSNPRALTYSTIHSYINSDQFVFVKFGDEPALGITIEKHSSFKTLEMERKMRSEW